MNQPQLFDLGYEDFTLQAHRCDDGTWTLRCAGRPFGEPWSSDSWVTYSSLSHAEMLDVIDCAISNQPTRL